jgi:excisionase family DNA binding protein
VDDLLTYSQASKVLNMKLGTLYALVAQNRVPHVRLSVRASGEQHYRVFFDTCE